MGCCDKAKRTIQKRATQVKHIVQGFTALARDKKCPETDERIRTCQQCERAWWRQNKRSLWCRECGCYIPAKARVKEERCPLNKWDKRKDKDDGSRNYILGRQFKLSVDNGG